MASWIYAPRSNDVKLSIWLAFIISAIGRGSALKCYKCSVVDELLIEGDKVITRPMCSKLNESNVIECPFSTMCLTTISSFQLQNGTIFKTLTRGCAQQKRETQILVGRHFQHHNTVEEVYKEGCEEFKGNDLAASVKTHCYCRGDLCNSGQSENVLHLLNSAGSESALQIMAVIVPVFTLCLFKL